MYKVYLVEKVRGEWYSPQAGYVVYCPPPGQSSGSRQIRRVEAGEFVGTTRACEDILGPYATWEEARAAAERDALRAGYPDAVIY